MIRAGQNGEREVQVGTAQAVRDRKQQSGWESDDSDLAHELQELENQRHRSRLRRGARAARRAQGIPAPDRPVEVISLTDSDDESDGLMDGRVPPPPVQMDAKAPARAPGSWNCSACTLINSNASATACSLCGTQRAMPAERRRSSRVAARQAAAPRPAAAPRRRGSRPRRKTKPRASSSRSASRRSSRKAPRGSTTDTKVGAAKSATSSQGGSRGWVRGAVTGRWVRPSATSRSTAHLDVSALASPTPKFTNDAKVSSPVGDIPSPTPKKLSRSLSRLGGDIPEQLQSAIDRMDRLVSDNTPSTAAVAAAPRSPVSPASGSGNSLWKRMVERAEGNDASDAKENEHAAKQVRKFGSPSPKRSRGRKVVNRGLRDRTNLPTVEATSRGVLKG